MKIILSILVILLSVFACDMKNRKGSKSNKIKNNKVIVKEKESFPWEIGCDTAGSQLEMNICSLESLNIADSILQKKYRKILKELEVNYEQEHLYEKDSLQLNYLKTLKEEITEFKKSKLIFEKYCTEMNNLVALRYDGGSIRPYMQNSLLLKLTVNQINILDEMYSE